MSKTSTKGICQFCKGEFSKAAMSRHLEVCTQRTATVVTGSRKPTKTSIFSGEPGWSVVAT